MRGKSPPDLVIHPRDRRFTRAGGRRWWLGGDPVATAFYNALSVTFPRGEAFFVDSVRAFRAGVTPALQAEIAAFVRQEVTHSREHLAFNRQVGDHGYVTAPLEADVEVLLAQVARHRPIVSLAATVALEHMTAILAHQLLADPRQLDGADAEARALWQWHAIEEIEHKGVAFDTFLHATRGWSGWARWRLRSMMMLIATGHFLRDRAKGALELLRQDGMTGPVVWLHLLAYAFGRPGMIRCVLPAWIGFFRPGFHPWNHDDRWLIHATTVRLSAAAVAP